MRGIKVISVLAAVALWVIAAGGTGCTAEAPQVDAAPPGEAAEAAPAIIAEPVEQQEEEDAKSPQ